MKEKQSEGGKKENRQANQVIKKAMVDEKREEGGPGKQTEARISPQGNSPSRGGGK